MKSSAERAGDRRAGSVGERPELARSRDSEVKTADAESTAQRKLRGASGSAERDES